MTKTNKLLERVKNALKDFSWAELSKLLKNMGYVEFNSGKTSGSRVRFINETIVTSYYISHTLNRC